MMPFLKSLLILLTVTLGYCADGETREETHLILDNRKLAIALPAGFSCTTGRDDGGLVAIKVADRGERYSVEIRFVADPEGKFSNARARRELMHELFIEYVGASREKGMQFEELEPRAGAGTYCVFTDSNLMGKSEFPPGEYLHLTSGMKAWPGVVAIFRFFSNDTSSPEYRAVMKMLRESVQEKPVPLR